MESSTPRPGTDPAHASLSSGFEPTRKASNLGDFSEFFTTHRAFVRRNLLRLGVSEASVDDASQELFIRAYRRRGDYLGQASPRCWLFAFVRRVAASYRRSEQRRERRHRTHAELRELEGEVPTEDDRWETRRLIANLLAGLSQEDRELIILVDLEGVSGPELAASRGLKLSVAYTQIRAARRRARKRLQALKVKPQSLSTTKYSPAGAPLLVDFPQLAPTMDPAAIAQVGAGFVPTLAVVKTGAVATSVLGLKVGAGAMAVTGMLALTHVVTPPSSGDQDKASIVRHSRSSSAPDPGPAHQPLTSPTAQVKAPAQTAVPSPNPATKPPRARPRPNPLGREIQLLEAAQAAFVAGNLGQTADLLRQAEGEFPTGSLVLERAQLRARVERALRAQMAPRR